MEAAGGGGATLTSAAEPYNASGKHETHFLAAYATPASIRFRFGLWPISRRTRIRHESVRNQTGFGWRADARPKRV